MNSEQPSTMSEVTVKSVSTDEKIQEHWFVWMTKMESYKIVQRKNLNIWKRKNMEQTIVSGEFEKRKIIIHCIYYEMYTLVVVMYDVYDRRPYRRHLKCKRTPYQLNHSNHCRFEIVSSYFSFMLFSLFCTLAMCRSSVGNAFISFHSQFSIEQWNNQSTWLHFTAVCIISWANRLFFSTF